MSTRMRRPHLFCAPHVATSSTLVDMFQGEINTHAGPTPLLFVTCSFDAPVPTTSESDSDVPTQPTDRPAATIIAPAPVVLLLKQRWDLRGVLQHVYEFSDVSVMLDSSTRKLGSYETDDDGTMMQHHAVLCEVQEGAQKPEALKNFHNLRPWSRGVLGTVRNYCWLLPFSKHFVLASARA